MLFVCIYTLKKNKTDTFVKSLVKKKNFFSSAMSQSGYLSTYLKAVWSLQTTFFHTFLHIDY